MKNLKLLLLSILLLSCSHSSPQQVDYFPGIKGCFVLYNVKTQTIEKIIGEETCKERFPACSTFKVPLAVMAFQAGILKDENQTLKWDGQKRFLDQWNKDQNAQTWMKESVVWFSQELTPKLGIGQFKKYLKDFQYGNQGLTGGITQAWLNPPGSSQALKISAFEQLEFMKKLWMNKLPVTERSMNLTKKIMFLETSPQGFELSGKTGSNFYDAEKKVQFGWFIGHIKKGDAEYITISNISDLKPTESKSWGGARSKEITKMILKDQNLW